MGSAISIFAGAQALCVPRRRFVPVKKNSDLLVLMSDAYRLDADFTLALAEALDGKPPVVTLDDRYLSARRYRRASPAGAPSLRRCTRLTVTGNVTFGADVTVLGSVTVAAPAGERRHIADGSTLHSSVR